MSNNNKKNKEIMAKYTIKESKKIKELESGRYFTLVGVLFWDVAGSDTVVLFCDGNTYRVKVDDNGNCTGSTPYGRRLVKKAINQILNQQ